MIVIPSCTPGEHARTHPWRKTAYGDHEESGKYTDFKQHPDLIESELEDFAAYSHESAIQKFYEMLRWLSRPEGLLETNDCAFRGPEKNQNTLFGKALLASGRLQFFMCDQRRNCHPESFLWLWRMFHIYLTLQDKDEDWVVFETSAEPTLFKAANVEGSRISVIFSAYGDSAEQCFAKLLKGFAGLFNVFRRLEEAMRVPVPVYP